MTEKTKDEGASPAKAEKCLKNGVKALNDALIKIKAQEDSRIALFTHRMPDPDAISSLMGLKWFLLRNYDIESDIFYDGEVAHPQNMTMVNLLDPSMAKVSDPEAGYKPDKYQFRMLADTIPEAAGVADHRVAFDVVFDHHKILPHNYEGILIHRKVGSCAAIIYDVMRQIMTPEHENWFDDDVDYDSKVATALIAGVMTDCNYCLADDSTEFDRRAVDELFPFRNSNFLHQIVFFKRPKFWIDTKARGCAEADINEEGFAIVGLGLIPAKERDLIADMAEEMISWASVETAVAFGVVDGDRIEGSVRSVNASVNVAEFCKKLGGEKGSGGGKHGKGAYRIPLSPPIDITAEDPQDVRDTWEANKKRETKRIRRILNK